MYIIYNSECISFITVNVYYLAEQEHYCQSVEIVTAQVLHINCTFWRKLSNL